MLKNRLDLTVNGQKVIVSEHAQFLVLGEVPKITFCLKGIKSSTNYNANVRNIHKLLRTTFQMDTKPHHNEDEETLCISIENKLEQKRNNKQVRPIMRFGIERNVCGTKRIIGIDFTLIAVEDKHIVLAVRQLALGEKFSDVIKVFEENTNAFKTYAARIAKAANSHAS